MFELSKVEHVHIRQAMVGHFRQIDQSLAKRVAFGLGMDAIPAAPAAAASVQNLPLSPPLQIIGKMKRGDLDKMSFAFVVEKEIWDQTVEPPLRTIVKCQLYDVAIVTTPAYAGTSIGLRNLDAARKSQKTDNFNAAALRRRLKMNLALKVRENG